MGKKRFKIQAPSLNHNPHIYLKTHVEYYQKAGRFCAVNGPEPYIFYALDFTVYSWLTQINTRAF